MHDYAVRDDSEYDMILLRRIMLSQLKIVGSIPTWDKGLLAQLVERGAYRFVYA